MPGLNKRYRFFFILNTQKVMNCSQWSNSK